MITTARLKRALRTVVADFVACGLYTKAMHSAPINLTWIGWSYGWCSVSGAVYIPVISILRIVDWFARIAKFKRPRQSLTDIVRHELAHTLAHLHEDVIDTPKFREVFGGDYWRDIRRASFHSDNYITPYATKAPCEDFAETVMTYTRHRGRLDKYSDRPGVVVGFEFVKNLRKDLQQQGLV